MPRRAEFSSYRETIASFNAACVAGSGSAAGIFRGDARAILTRSSSRSSCFSRLRWRRSSPTTGAGSSASLILRHSRGRRKRRFCTPGRDSVIMRAPGIFTRPPNAWLQTLGASCRTSPPKSLNCLGSAAHGERDCQFCLRPRRADRRSQHWARPGPPDEFANPDRYDSGPGPSLANGDRAPSCAQGPRPQLRFDGYRCTLCLPRRPRCGECPVRRFCRADIRPCSRVRKGGQRSFN